MRLPNYNNQKNLEKLAIVIKTIFVYDAKQFRVKNLKKMSGISAHFLIPHLKHLLEEGYLSREEIGESREHTKYRYSVNDWKKLEDYCWEIIGRLPSEFVDYKLLGEERPKQT